jgi:DNA repair protein RadC
MRTKFRFVPGSFFGTLRSVDAIETLRIIHFDQRRIVLAVAEYAGEATRVVLPLRTVIAEALRLGTTGLLLSHNHPSGDPTPSRADITATHRLSRVAEPLGIRVHDHLIEAVGSCVSFRALGLL